VPLSEDGGASALLSEGGGASAAASEGGGTSAPVSEGGGIGTSPEEAASIALDGKLPHEQANKPAQPESKTGHPSDRFMSIPLATEYPSSAAHNQRHISRAGRAEGNQP
jgi:hypothetical protein